MKIRLLIVLLFFPFGANAQWSYDPQNALIIDSASNQMDAENIFVGNSFLFSWVRTYGSRPKRMLARYSADGYKVWEHNNMLQTTDRLIINSLYDKINLRSDPDGNIYIIQIAEHKDSLDFYPIVAKVDYDGNPVWSTGRELFRSGFNAEGHSLCCDKWGNCFFAARWMESNSKQKQIILYKISDQGLIEWQKVLPEYDYVSVFHEWEFHLWPAEREGFYAIYTSLGKELNDDGREISKNEIRINKFSVDGEAEWERDEIINQQKSGLYRLKVTRDEEGCFYTIWKDYPDLKMQKTSKDGYPLWDPWGIELTQYPRVAGYYYFGGRYSNGDFLVFYTQENDSLIDLFGQKITPYGEKLWGESGKLIRQFKSDCYYTPYIFQLYDDTAFYFFDQRDTVSYYHSAGTFIEAIDRNGDQIWESPLLATSHKWHVLSRDLASDGKGRFLFSWTTNKFRYYLRAQSFYLDKTFGNKATSIGNIEIHNDRQFVYDYVNQTINFLSPGNDDEFNLFNIQGQLIKEGKGEDRVSIGNLPSGFYILRVLSPGERTETLKIYKH